MFTACRSGNQQLGASEASNTQKKALVNDTPLTFYVHVFDFKKRIFLEKMYQ